MQSLTREVMKEVMKEVMREAKKSANHGGSVRVVVCLSIPSFALFLWCASL